MTESDNTWFTLLTMNTNQIHFNAQDAARTEFAKPLVNSTLTIAIAVGQSVTDVSQNVFANLQMDEVRLPHPVFAGDTLWSESPVLTKRESGSRPHAGIVTVRTRTLNQDGGGLLVPAHVLRLQARRAGVDRHLPPGQIPDRRRGLSAGLSPRADGRVKPLEDIRIVAVGSSS